LWAAQSPTKAVLEPDYLFAIIQQKLGFQGRAAKARETRLRRKQKPSEVRMAMKALLALFCSMEFAAPTKNLQKSMGKSPLINNVMIS
jgi:hypothetical protein